MILADQIKELEQRREALERCLGIDQKRIDLRNEEEKTQEPDFWDTPDKAREQLRKVAAIKAWVDDYDVVAKDVEDLGLMPDFVKEGVMSEAELDDHYAQTLERIETLEMRNMLRREEDKLGAISDAGGVQLPGDEAQCGIGAALLVGAAVDEQNFHGNTLLLCQNAPQKPGAADFIVAQTARRRNARPLTRICSWAIIK